MAIRNDERLHNVAEQEELESLDEALPSDSYLSWPRDPRVRFKNIKDHIRRRPGRSCDIVKLVYQRATLLSIPTWLRDRHCRDFDMLNQVLHRPRHDHVEGELYLISSMDAEPLQLMGHHLQIDERLFNMSWTRRFRGLHTAHSASLIFGLSFMDDFGTQQIRKKEFEADKTDDLQGTVLPNWRSTQVRVAFSEDPVPRGIIVFDERDTEIHQALEVFTKRLTHAPPGGVPGKAGLGVVLTELFYILLYTWDTFLGDTRDNLNDLERDCITSSLSPEKELEYTLRLHKIRQITDDARQYIIGLRDLIDFVKQHPYFTSQAPEQAYPEFKTLADHQRNLTIGTIGNCDQVQVHATRLSGLIDAKRAVAEGVKSNASAASMRRVTFLTFFYLPLTLVASIFGMNVSELVSDGADVPIWTFFAVAFPAMLLTFCVWGMWAKRMELASLLTSASRGKGKDVKHFV